MDKKNESTERVSEQSESQLGQQSNEEETDDKATLAPKEESSRNADGEESKVSEGHWPNWRSTVGLLAGALSQRGRV